MKPGNYPSWDDLYRNEKPEDLPWFYPGLDPEVAQGLLDYRIASARVLDLGTGPGTQARALAARGFAVTGTDISQTAISGARARAPDIAFAQDDILDSKLKGPFDLIVDRGVFHVFALEERPAYVETVQRLLAPGGYLFLKCFSTDQPGDQGPKRIAAEEIHANFADDFEVRSITPAIFLGNNEPPPKALFCVIQRRP